MSEGPDDFMLEEYKQITQAFIALHTQRNAITGTQEHQQYPEIHTACRLPRRCIRFQSS